MRTYIPKTTIWNEASCFSLKKRVLSGYDNPKECDANNNTCIMVQSPICVQNNSRCVERRKAVVKSNLQMAGVYNKSFGKLENAEKAVEMNFIELLEGEKRYLFAKRDYEKDLALLGQSELEVKLMNRSILNSNSKFALETCLSELTGKGNTAFVKIRKMKFDSNTAAQENILFKLDVEVIESGRLYEKSFLFDLRDSDVSLESGARRIAREIFCQGKSRKRRAVSDAESDADTGEYFLQSTASIPLNTSDAQRVCLVSKTIFSFYDKTFDELRTKVLGVKNRVRNIEATVASISSNVKDITDTTVKRQNQLLSSMRQALEDDYRQLRAEDVIREWLDDMEIVTGANNFTKCLSFQDCFLEAQRQLTLMPSMLAVKRSEFLAMVEESTVKFRSILQSKSISSLWRATRAQQAIVKSIQQSSSFCASTPNVDLKPAVRVAATVGSTLRLECTAHSSLPVKYSWMHNNIHLLSESSNTLVLDVGYDNQGAYICTASNIAGRNSSQETYVEVRQAPRFTNEPQDVQYYFSMAKERVPYFVCNVTSDPPSDIFWYFQAYGSTRSSQFAYDKPVLRIVRPSVSKSGFYYCTAQNDFGKITSKKARLDVLKSRLPNQAFSVSFGIKVGRSGAPEKTAYEKRLAAEGKLTASQDVNVAFEYRSGRDVNVNVQVVDNLSKNVSESRQSEISEIEMLRTVSRSRLQLSGVLERIVTGLTRNRGRSANDALEKSMSIGFNGKMCQRGYFLHSNGFTCGKSWSF